MEGKTERPPRRYYSIGGRKYTAEQAHRKMWEWLASHPRNNKLDFMLVLDVYPRPVDDCFACDEVDHAREHNSGRRRDCRKCPLTWIDGFGLQTECESDGTVYRQYTRAVRTYSFQEASEAAQAIAEMEWREEVRPSGD